MTERIRAGVARFALLAGALLLASCEEESTGPTQDPCTGGLVAHVSSSGDPLHSHHPPLLCEEDRGASVDFRLRGTDHTHAVGFSRLEIGDVLGGEALGKASSAALGHTHWVGFHH